MQITIFSVWMTFVWCNIFIVLCYILRKRSVLLNLSSMTGIIILYLFCLIRLVVPVELPWTKVVSGGSLYNFLYQIFGCEITCVWQGMKSMSIIYLWWHGEWSWQFF